MDDPSHSATPVARRRLIPFALLGILVLGSGVAAFAATRHSAPSTVPGPEGVPIVAAPDLAPASSTLPGQPVGPIRCVTEANEVVNFHTHTSVSIFVNGSERRLPGGIGITQPWLVETFSSGLFYDVGPKNCIYWIHTHTADDIVHVEAPAKGVFTLGELFAIWNQPLSASQVGPALGPVTVVVNGRAQHGDVAAIRLVDHGSIQINVGGPVVVRTPKSFVVTGLCGQGTKGCAAPRG